MLLAGASPFTSSPFGEMWREGLPFHQKELWNRVALVGPQPAHLSSVSFFAMGQGLLRMVAMSFFFSSTCSKIRASSSSDRDSPPEALEAKEDDLEAEPGQRQRGDGKEVVSSGAVE